MISIIWIFENFKIDFVFIFHIKFIFLDVLWEASIVKLWSVYGLTRMAYQRNALLRWMQHECPNVHHVMLLSIIIKSNKNSYLITVQSDKYQTTKSFFCVKWLPWKTHFEPLYVQWTLPLCNQQWPANSYKTYDLYRFQQNKTCGTSNTFFEQLNDLCLHSLRGRVSGIICHKWKDTTTQFRFNYTLDEIERIIQ